MGVLTSIALLMTTAVVQSRRVVDERYTPPPGRKYQTSSERVDGAINLHFIPHTHDDVGWVKTVDEYYSGIANYIFHGSITYIITSVIDALQKDPNRRFIYVEQAYFQRWWAEQTNETQAIVQNLVSSGRLEFANGGYSMHDEANPTYSDMLDNTFIGQRNIRDEFGSQFVPNITWQIDPFGHSSFQGLLSTPAAGYGAVFWARISDDDRTQRVADKSLEFIWQPSSSQGPAMSTFGHTFRVHYSAPQGFSFDMTDMNDDKIVDNPDLETYNVVDKVTSFIQLINSTYANSYLGSDILLTFGDDFEYEQADEYFINLDKLMHYVNQNISGHNFHALYATPSSYLAAKISDPTVELPLNTYDFFPYESGENSLWAGYFTSRPALKGYVRTTSAVFNTARQLQVLAPSTRHAIDGMGRENPLWLLERAMATVQHHDGITGTEWDNVAGDYAYNMDIGRAAALEMMNGALIELTGGFIPGGTSNGSWAVCDLANETICAPLQTPAVGEAVVLLSWNPMGQNQGTATFRVPVGMPTSVASWAVYDAAGVAVQAQLIPISSYDAALRAADGGDNVTIQWLAWTGYMPAIGYSTSFLVAQSSVGGAPLTHISHERKIEINHATGTASLRGQPGVKLADQTITNGVVTLTFSSATGLLNSYSNSQTGISVPLTSDMAFYNGSGSTNYYFGPYQEGTGFNAVFPPPTVIASSNLTIITGPIVNEARVSEGSWVGQAFRLWPNSGTVEVEWTVGPIGMTDHLNKDVIARYNVTGWDTNASWQTDSNCREMQPRVRNVRPTYKSTTYNPISANYYPVGCAIRMKDSSSRYSLTVVNDRAQGGGSITDASLELMVHRRLCFPGALAGCDLVFLDDASIVRGRHWLTIDKSYDQAASQKSIAQTAMFPPQYLYAPAGVSPSRWVDQYKSVFAGAPNELPINVHIISAHAQSNTTVLVRLAHLFEINDDPNLSQNATVSLSGLFAGITVTSAVEMTMIGTIPLAATKSYTYNVQGGQTLTLPVIPPPPSGTALDVTLSPMQIRTFLLTVQF